MMISIVRVWEIKPWRGNSFEDLCARSYIEQEKLPIRVIRSTANKDLLNMIEEVEVGLQSDEEANSSTNSPNSGESNPEQSACFFYQRCRETQDNTVDISEQIDFNKEENRRFE